MFSSYMDSKTENKPMLIMMRQDSSELSCVSILKLLFRPRTQCPLVLIVGNFLGDSYSLSLGRSSGQGFIFCEKLVCFKSCFKWQEICFLRR
jgi:hypothetical protein